MNMRSTSVSIATVLAASVLALQAPIAGAADNTAATGANTATSQSARNQQGVPGVELNVGDNASDRGLPGVEMNVGRDGDQNNIDTRELGAGADRGMTGGTDIDDQSSMNLPMRADRG